MKVPALFYALLTLLLAATASAATTTIPASANPTWLFQPHNSQGKEPTHPTNDSVLFASLVTYDHKAANSLVDLYNSAINGNNSFNLYNSAVRRNNSLISRTNAVTRAVTPSKDILPFCVAVAKNPTRTRIFKNRQICDGKGWQTLFIFTAHTKRDPHHAAYAACVAYSKALTMSMVFERTETCNPNAWKTDFVFYMSGQMYFNDPKVSQYHESSVQWITNFPDRVMIYPYYQGDKHGWTGHRPTSISYRSR
ncbi:hypothetical protein BGW39_004244 [Mortierella sp. 14UC]|nr:hypothetical protein BGW39_004244 [Mortierella sp. 14UC]